MSLPHVIPCKWLITRRDEKANDETAVTYDIIVAFICNTVTITHKKRASVLEALFSVWLLGRLI